MTACARCVVDRRCRHQSVVAVCGRLCVEYGQGLGLRALRDKDFPMC
jgi:hypothetical protein